MASFGPLTLGLAVAALGAGSLVATRCTWGEFWDWVRAHTADEIVYD